MTFRAVATFAVFVIGVAGVMVYHAQTGSRDRAPRSQAEPIHPIQPIGASVPVRDIAQTHFADSKTSAAESQTPAGQSSLQSELVTSGTIRGRVVDAVTGIPITDFRTKITSAYIDRTIERKSFSSPEGLFFFSGLNPSRRYMVEVLAQGRAPVTLREIRTDGKGRELLFKLEQGTPLTLRLIDQSSKLPIHGAYVVWSGRSTEIPETTLTEWKEDSGERTLDRLDYAEISMGRLHARTDADGIASLVERDQPAYLWIVAKGYATRMLTPAERLQYANHQGQMTIPLSKESALEGVVILDDTPAAAARVILSGGGRPDIACDTDDQGRYSFRYVPPGTYDLRIPKIIGNTSLIVLEKRVSIGTGEIVKLNIGDDLGDGSLFGKVVSHGKPAANYVVSVKPGFEWDYRTFEAATDEFGRYSMFGLRPGRYQVTVTPLGHGAGLEPITQPIEVHGKLERNFELMPASR